MSRARPLRARTSGARLLTPDNHDSLNEFRVRNESDYPAVLIHHHDRRPDMRIRRIQPLDLESLELRVGRDDGRIMARMGLGRAVGGVVARGHAPHHDVAVRDRAEEAAVLWVVHHRHDRDVLRPHQERDFGGRRSGGGDVGVRNHYVSRQHRTSRTESSRHLGVYLDVWASHVPANARLVASYPALRYLSPSPTANVASRSATALTTTSRGPSFGHAAIARSVCAAIMTRIASPCARINGGGRRR